MQRVVVLKVKKINVDKKTVKRIIENIAYPLAALGIVLAVWAICAKVKGNPLVLPMPSKVLARFFALGGEKGFWSSVGSSLLRTLICFAISFAAAMIFAVLGGLFKPLHKLIAPIVSLLRSAPTVAVILIFYAFMSSNAMSVAVGFLIAFPILYSSIYSAIVGVDKELLEMAKVYKVKPADVAFGIYLPSIAPCLFDTSKSTLSLTLKVVVAAEILACVSKSIGGKIQTANATFEIEYLLAWTLVAIVFGFALEGVVALLKKVWEVAR